MSFCVESQLWLRSLERWFCIARHFNCKGIVFISRYIFSSFCVCLSVCACALFVCPGVLTGVLWLTHKWHKAVHTCTERSCAGCAWASGDSADIDLLFRECREPGLNRPPSQRRDTHTQADTHTLLPVGTCCKWWIQTVGYKTSQASLP